jgi:hypothetical protein
MRASIVLAAAALSPILIGSCSRPRSTAAPASSISEIRSYADSFHGLSVNEARNKLAGGDLREETWNEGSFGGMQLVAEFPEHEVRVMFLNDKVITTSIQVISK